MNAMERCGKILMLLNKGMLALKQSSVRYVAFDRLWMIIGLGVILRIVFMGVLDLLPEEAYYWNYAKHLDIGYLDHPPMVAWLIYLSESVLGKSEFAVRLPAFLGWFVFAYFMYRFTENTLGKGVGKPVMLLLAVLPIYMSVGFLMTPDAPFYVCWAGALFFLERAIIGGKQSAWYGAGACLGLGLLSKYTMGLIVPATVVYLIIDRESRRWFLKPQPYLALLIAFILFLPVVIWNMQHEWASFAFQGIRRWSGGADFHLHILVGSILVLITPLGLFEAIKVLVLVWKRRIAEQVPEANTARTNRFLMTFTLVPLAVFVIHSLQGQPKLNWTGPVWLSILPLVAAMIAMRRQEHAAKQFYYPVTRWIVTASALLILYSGGFGYMVAGMPGIEKSGGMKFPIAWKEYGDRIERVESKVGSEAGAEPIIIGLDNYWLASQASFYDHEDQDSLPEVAGRGLIGENGLMWNRWVTPEETTGRTAILVSYSAEKLSKNWVTRRFSHLGEITEETLTGCDGEIGHFFWRAGYNYNGDGL